MEPLNSVLNRLDQKKIWSHLEYLSRLDKLSGTPAAQAASDYITAQLCEMGIPHQEYRFDEFLSNPVSSSLTLQDGREITSRPRSFSANCPGGVEGELVFDPNNRRREVNSAQWEAFLEGCRGKIVLSHGFDEQYAKRLERHGVLAWIQVWESGEALIHEDTVSGVWGTPTQDSALLLPTIPVIGISGPDGQWLEAQIARERTTARITATVETGVFPVVMPSAEIPGRTSDFLLLSCHYDSWYLGAMDNCAANAAALEMARAFWEHRDELERGIRIVWWAGHSNGRYAGSTWYCDNHWQLLHDHCIAHITSDLLGCMGTDRIGVHTTGAEGRELIRQAADAAAPGVPLDFFSVGRGADQSFWGPEIPFHFYSRSICSRENRPSATPGPGAPWWHTSEDTLEKVDPDVLSRDAGLFYLSAWKLAAAVRLPFGTDTYLPAIRNDLTAAAQDCDPVFDLNPVVELLDRLAGSVNALLRTEDDGLWNQTVRLVCGRLNRLRQCYGSPYDHDLAFSASGAFPRLCCVKGKRREDMSPEDFLFLRTDFVRQRNRVLHELDQLLRELSEIHATATGGKASS